MSISFDDNHYTTGTTNWWPCRWCGLTPLQRWNQCILQPQSTGWDLVSVNTLPRVVALEKIIFCSWKLSLFKNTFMFSVSVLASVEINPRIYFPSDSYENNHKVILWPHPNIFISDGIFLNSCFLQKKKIIGLLAGSLASSVIPPIFTVDTFDMQVLVHCWQKCIAISCDAMEKCFVT